MDRKIRMYHVNCMCMCENFIMRCFRLRSPPMIEVGQLNQQGLVFQEIYQAYM